MIGAQVDPLGRAFANVAYERPGTGDVRPIGKSLVCLNPEELWKVGFDGNLAVYDLRYSLTHEIGHTIGLDHPGGADQVMSYRYEEQFAHLQQGDIGGAIALYGSKEELLVASPNPQTVSGSREALSPGGGNFDRDQQTRAMPSHSPDARRG